MYRSLKMLPSVTYDEHRLHLAFIQTGQEDSVFHRTNHIGGLDIDALAVLEECAFYHPAYILLRERIAHPLAMAALTQEEIVYIIGRQKAPELPVIYNGNDRRTHP